MVRGDTWPPLLPLKAVLFPDVAQSLNVFETRYIDMIRDCIRRDAPFSAVLNRGIQDRTAAAPETVGCVAHITDCDMQAPGILKLWSRGAGRFRILEIRTLADWRLAATDATRQRRLGRQRWSEILPASPKARQKLLELEDPQTRLRIIHHCLLQHKSL